MTELFELIAKTYGLIGLLLFSPFVAVVYLFRDNRSLRKDLMSIQEMRIKDAQAVSEKLMEMASENSSISKETNIVLGRITETMSRCSRR